MTWFFVNGRKAAGSTRRSKAKRSRKARPARKGRKAMARRQSPAQRRASLRNLAKARRATKGSAPKRRRRRNPPPGGKRTSVWRGRKHKARKYSYGSRQKRVIRTNSPRRHRRSVRRNPGFSFKGIMGEVMSGGKTVVGIYGGKAAVNTVFGFVPTSLTVGADGKPTLAAPAIKLAIGLLAAPFVSRMLGREIGTGFLAGAIMSVTDPYAKALPVIGPALGDYDYYVTPFGAYENTTMQAYENGGMAGLPLGEQVILGEYQQGSFVQ